MRDLRMDGLDVPTGIPPKGLAFEIDDLVLVKDWAERNGVRFTVRLDHGSQDEEFDEVIALHTDANLYCNLIIWRNLDSVFVQPLIGRSLQYDSVRRALESVALNETVVLSDIVAPVWPD
jgi:hypothetical protein